MFIQTIPPYQTMVFLPLVIIMYPPVILLGAVTVSVPGIRLVKTKRKPDIRKCHWFQFCADPLFLNVFESLWLTHTALKK